MKNLKKLGLGLTALLMLILALSFSKPGNVEAAGSTSNPLDIKKCMQNLTFINVAEIDCTFTPAGQSNSITVKFIDSNPSDNNSDSNGTAGISESTNVLNYAQQGDFFINGNDSSKSCGNPGCANGPGINVQGPGSNDRINGPLTQDDAGKHFNLFVNLEYHDSKTGQDAYPCENFSNTCSSSAQWSVNHLPNTDVVGPIMQGSKTQGLANLLQFKGQNAVSLDGVTDGALSGQTYGLDASYKSGPLVLTQNFDAGSCAGDVLLLNVASSDRGIATSAQMFALNNTGQDLGKNYPRLLDYLNFKNASNCGVEASQTNFYGATYNPFSITGTPPSLSGGNGTQTSTAPNDTSSQECTDDPSFAWIVCPVVSGLSKSADGMDNFVESQLNFSVKDNLNDSVHRAWTIFRTLTSVIIVIVMLVMVFSQAVGGGPFDAYTVRKLLPKLVAAIILMQISWPICQYLIGLSNDAGHAIGQLMAAPFGGPNALELPALLARWSHAGAVAFGAVTTLTAITAIVAGGFLIAYGWPVLVLAIVMVFITLIVALATLLVRNALIILLVMTTPLALITFVMPGMDGYWKKWKDNFVRVLAFFPLVIGLVYAGRIFAWVVAGISGPFDLIMILAGFFGPYVFLPKTFKWAGPAVAAAADAINNSFPIKKGREVAGRELMARQKEKQNELVDKYYSSLVWGKNGKEGKEADMGSRVRAGLKRGIVRTAGGHPIPTKRQTARMMQEAGKWKEEEIALREGKINNDYKEFQRRLGVAGAKKAIRDKYYDPSGKDALGNRSFFTWAYDTKSFMEMGEKGWRTGKNDPSDPNEPDKYEDMFKTQGWIDFMHGNSNAYGDFSARLGASSVPYRLPRGGGPSIEDYLPPDTSSGRAGGKRFNIMGYRSAVKTNDDGTVMMDENNHPVYETDAEGRRIPNVYYNPGLQRRLAASPNSPETHHLAELASDSERFTKLISQSDDPMTVVSQRPEEFAALAKITAELHQAGAESPGQLSLKAFIDQQSQTLAGRNVLQRLTLSAAPHIDEMMGQKDYVQSRLTPTSATAEAGEIVPAGTRAEQPASPADTAPARPVAQAVGAAATGVGTQGGVVRFGGPAEATSSNMPPIEIHINHNELARAIGESVRDASEYGTHKGMEKALKEAGLHRGGGGPTEPSNEEDRNT